MLSPWKTDRTRLTVLHERPLAALATQTISSVDAGEVKITSLHGMDPDELRNMPALGTAPSVAKELDRAESNDYYPFAAMMQGSAAYIANHAGNTAVIHIPSERLSCDTLLQDIGLCWLLGMKLVLIVSGQRHVSHDSIRRVEQEAGFLRTEMERILNRCLRTHRASANVVSGNNFCFARRHSPDGYDGRATTVQSSKIQQVLNQNDVVLLSPVVLSESGEDWVQVEGHQLAAHVAVKLKAAKLIYLVNESSILQTLDGTHVQDLPLSLAQRIVEKERSKQRRLHNGSGKGAPPVDLLHPLAWASCAVDRGVKRAHIVNPSDGALLEELFTAQNGANTCLYHDDELLEQDDGYFHPYE